MLAAMSMNRQLRRAQEKQDKKVEKERQERRDERRRRLDQLRAQRKRQVAARQANKGKDQAAGKDSGKSGGARAAAAPSRNDPGRFSGALAIATVVFILLQAVVPTESDGTFYSVVKAGFYLMLGYFMTLWLMRRDMPNPIVLTGMAGIILLTGTWLGYLLRPDAAVDGLAMILAVPLLVGGILLGRLVFNLARSQNQG